MLNLSENTACQAGSSRFFYTVCQAVFQEHVVIHRLSAKYTGSAVELIGLYETFGVLLPEEIVGASMHRQMEYLIGRLAVQQALDVFDCRFFPVLNGQYREPVWPTGLIGSISHSMQGGKEGVAVSCALSGYQATAIGIDIESIVNKKFHSSLLSVVLSEQDINYLQNFHLEDRLIYLIVFSAKESVFKAFSSSMGRTMDFKSIQCTRIDLEAGAIDFFMPSLVGSGLPYKVRVDYQLLQEEVITLCLID